MTVAIIGAGLAGLSTAFHLGKNAAFSLFEAEARPGGHCRTNHWDGFTFDFTGHVLHIAEPYMKTLVEGLLGDELVPIDRRAHISTYGVLTEYPFQTNTHGLPPDIVKECLLGVIEANYEPPDTEPKTFEDWILASCGTGIARHFMLPYNEKLWRVPAADMAIDWIGRFVPRTSIEEAIQGALGRREQRQADGYNARFYYPRSGGMQALPGAFAARLPKDSLRLEEPVLQIEPRTRKLRTKAGVNEYSRLVSTVPLPKLVDLLDAVPAAVAEAARSLKWVSVAAVCVAVRGTQNTNSHWVYVPEPQFAPYRIGFPSNLVSRMAPDGCKSYIVEISYSDWHPIDHAQISEQAIRDLTKLEFLAGDDEVLFTRIIDLPIAYVLFDHSRDEALATILSYLDKVGIASVGRYGRWEYSAMEDAVMDGRRTARRLLND